MKKDKNYWGNTKKNRIVFSGIVSEPPTDKELAIGTLVGKNKIGFRIKKICSTKC